jgi:hypothetical protein
LISNNILPNLRYVPGTNSDGNEVTLPAFEDSFGDFDGGDDIAYDQGAQQPYPPAQPMSAAGRPMPRAPLAAVPGVVSYQDSLADDGIHGCPIIGYGWCYQASSSRRHRQPCN